MTLAEKVDNLELRVAALEAESQCERNKALELAEQISVINCTFTTSDPTESHSVRIGRQHDPVVLDHDTVLSETQP
jgi:hypothetical protein